MKESDILQIKDAISDLVKESVYEQTVHKDKEVSALHREIRNDIKSLIDTVDSMKTKVDAHDAVINELNDIWKTSGRITKFLLWIIFFVPGAAAFIAGIIYLKSIFYPQ